MPNIDNLDDVIDKKIERRLTARQSTFYYIVGSSPDKKGNMKSFLLGPYPDYARASSVAEGKRLTSYTIESLPTSDLGRAGQILKARRLHSGEGMSSIFERVKHKNVGQEDNTI